MNIPKFVKNIIEKLEEAGSEAYIVGGCVRDLLMGKEPKDWDVTTNALPEEIIKIFPDSFYENEFGTVLVKIKNKKGETENIAEVTTFRSEQGYSDRRHPDKVIFEKDLDKDLSRRDFTINAMAIKLKVNPVKFESLTGQESQKSKVALDYETENFSSFLTAELAPLKQSSLQKPKKSSVSKMFCDSQKVGDYKIIDFFGGQKDIKKKIIRAVGEPVDRFKEDALRMMRAVRFACVLGFEMEPKTERAIIKMAGSIKFISNERIKDELIKILQSDKPYDGIMRLHNTKLLQYILPELEQGVGVKQDRHHIYTVFKHSMLALKFCPNKDWQVRLAALLHDIGKPKTKKFINGIATFYNHEYVGARMARKIASRLKFSSADSDRVVNLIRNHMFYYNPDEVTASSVRRLIQKAGKDNLSDLIDIRVADRLGSGVPKAKPYKLRHLEYMMKRVQNDPISVKMLKINGDDVMKILAIKPGPKIGAILDVLLSEVIEDPKLNNKKYLEKRIHKLNELELKELRSKAREAIEEKRESEDKEMKKEFWVK